RGSARGRTRHPGRPGGRAGSGGARDGREDRLLERLRGRDREGGVLQAAADAAAARLRLRAGCDGDECGGGGRARGDEGVPGEGAAEVVRKVRLPRKKKDPLSGLRPPRLACTRLRYPSHQIEL